MYMGEIVLLGYLFYSQNDMARFVYEWQGRDVDTLRTAGALMLAGGIYLVAQNHKKLLKS